MLIGICIGHAAPEAAAGAGGLELVCDGDVVTIDVEGRMLNYVPFEEPGRVAAIGVAEAIAAKRKAAATDSV